MRSKRGQAALEFLMTYGWAILVVLVAIAALAYFGVLNPDMFVPDKCVIASSSGLFCDDYTATAGAIDVNKIILVIRNNLGEKVNINSVVIEDTNLGADCVYMGSDFTIEANSEVEMRFNCRTTITENQRVRGIISIEYTRGSNSLLKKTQGDLVITARALPPE